MSLTTTARPRGRTRMSLAIVAVLGLLGMIFAPAAVAATTVTYNGAYTGGHVVWMNGESHGTSVFKLDVAGGGTLRAYCVDLGVPISAGDTYEIQQLTNQIPNPAKVLWILQHSYPVLTVNQLAAASGVAALDTASAVAGTQAAIWHYTDGRTLDTSGTKNNDSVRALYAYLTGAANVGASSQPAPSLSITPATTTALSGRVGPFTINWSGSTPVDLATDPAFTIFDAASGGSAVTSASDGDEVWVEVPSGTAPGDVVVTATGSAPVDGGWALVNPDRPNGVQKLAFAGVQTLSASSSATITVEPTPTDPGTTPPATTPPATTPPATEPATTPPATSTTPATPTSTEPGLADTGAGSTSGLALAGVAALLLGAGAMVLGSTRRQGRHS